MNTKEEIIRKHLIVAGRVQGVGFRYYAVLKARALGLTGWVQNLFDGTVEMEVQGTDEKIDQLIAFLDSQRYISIERIDSRRQKLKAESDFHEKGW